MHNNGYSYKSVHGSNNLAFKKIITYFSMNIFFYTKHYILIVLLFMI